jgi:histidyl-tRNA synthetase
MARVKALRGMRDILPAEIRKWHLAEGKAREIFGRYGYREIRTPILEPYELFARGVGESTDIVHKEMYVLERERERVALRPENTASVVRAYIEHSLQQSSPVTRLYYVGPQFRYERPQKGRQRQFHQIGVEVLGEDAPMVDAEAIAMVLEYLAALRLGDLHLLLNSVGCPACRSEYRGTLRGFLKPRLAELCEDCNRRYGSNPLRVFDCKVKADRQVLEEAPRILEHLCEDCREHFDGVRQGLDGLDVHYRLEPRLVRGLDYYVRTAFEVTSSKLGSQDAVLGGGRYDGLVEDLGGPAAPGFGFAIGLERIILLLPDDHPELSAGGIDLFLVGVGAGAHGQLPGLASRLRAAGMSVLHDYRPRALGSQMKRADRLGARLALIVGDEELARNACVLKRMSDGSQQEVALELLAGRARDLLQVSAPDDKGDS